MGLGTAGVIDLVGPFGPHRPETGIDPGFVTQETIWKSSSNQTVRQGRAGKSIYGYDRLAGGRQPPFSEEAEQAVLGAAMVDKEAVGLAREKIDFADFYRLEHQLIFRAMCRLYENDQAIDPITVADLLQKSSEQFLDKAQQKACKDQDLLEVVGGMDFLIDLAGMMGTAANVIYHAGIVREKAVLRNLITVSNTIAAEAFEGGDEAAKILDRAQGRIYDISEETRVGGFAGVSTTSCRAPSSPSRRPSRAMTT